jgi:hypothetical protein
MNEEVILWRYRLAGLLKELGNNAAERLILSVIASAVLVALVALFFTIGQFAAQFETSYRWVSVGLVFTFCAGFLTHLRPIHLQRSLSFLPLAPRTITWHNISAGLRFPVLIGAMVIIPYFVGKNTNWFYSVTDLLSLIVGTLSLLVAGYLTSVALALGIRTVTRHTFIRLLALIATLVLAFEFLVGPNLVTSALEQTLLEVNRTAILLLAIGSLGVCGAAVALIELCDPLPNEQQPHRYWNFFDRTRNFRATYSEIESSLLRTILSVIRTPLLHLKLSLLLLFLIVFRAILSSTVPQYPSLEIALQALGLGLAAYILNFSIGQQAIGLEQKLFFTPTQNRKTAIGSLLGSLIVYILFISLFSAENLLGNWLTAIIALVIGVVGYLFGRREAQAESVAPITWLALLVALPTIMAVILSSVTEQTTLPETILLTLCWVFAYVALPFLFGSKPRSDSVTAVQ